tara:strand:- start:6898 stop:7839 length:942 start_codon:yes stop_codon:yes gene_type:complete
MLLKKGSKGKEVKDLQQFLGLTADGIFGSKTEEAVKKWQWENGLTMDGIVGPETSKYMGLMSTDLSETVYTTSNGLSIEQYFLPKGEYLEGPTKKEYAFLHHTAGWHKPKQVVDSWGRDKRGPVGTEFVLGGQSIKGNSTKYDGELLQCMPEGDCGWHLGIGRTYMHTHSVGIEVCAFGQLTQGGYYKKINKKKVWISKDKNKFYTYVGTEAHPEQIAKLSQEFRGFKHYHKYSDKQIEVLKNWILFIADRDNIDVRDGLVKWIKEDGPFKAFEFNGNAYYGKVKGLLTHTNIKSGKWDMFPQPELIDMLVSL